MLERKGVEPEEGGRFCRDQPHLEKTKEGVRELPTVGGEKEYA